MSMNEMIRKAAANFLALDASEAQIAAWVATQATETGFPAEEIQKRVVAAMAAEAR